FYTEARLSREAWRRSMDASDLARGEETGCDFRDAEGRLEEICRDERVEDSDAVIIGTSDHITGIGDHTTGTGYRTIGIAGTRWRSCTARAARGGW
ncbi:hypothetical protein Tco_0419552, partial [Tanacetum coccineum]